MLNRIDKDLHWQMVNGEKQIQDSKGKCNRRSMMFLERKQTNKREKDKVKKQQRQRRPPRHLRARTRRRLGSFEAMFPMVMVALVNTGSIPEVAVTLVDNITIVSTLISTIQLFRQSRYEELPRSCQHSKPVLSFHQFGQAVVPCFRTNKS